MYEKEIIENLREFSAKYLYEDQKLSETCFRAADAIEELSMKLHGDEAAIAGMKREIERMVVAGTPKWIPVAERLPEEKCKCLVYKKHTGLSALVSFTNDLESIDKYDFQGQKRWGFFYYDSEYGFCESLGVTHWMPLPEPPKEEKDG